MAKINLQNMAGDMVGDLDLKAEVFEVEPNIALMHQAVVAEQANMRQGTADTKNRREVRGGGAKPYRQKGTGRARQGSIRAPHYYHGGVVFGPGPRSYNKAMPKKMKKGALRSALSARVADEAVVVLDEMKLDKVSTKNMAALLNGLGATRKALVVLDAVSVEIMLSSRNIPDLELRVAPCVSVRDILNAEKIVMTKAAVAKLEEVFA